MGTGAITAYIDVAQLVLYAFWIFFAGLIYYLHPREPPRGLPDGDRRAAAASIDRLADVADAQDLPAAHDGQRRCRARAESRRTQLERRAGAPLRRRAAGADRRPDAGRRRPGLLGDLRPDEPDLDHHGTPKIVPLRLAPESSVSAQDTDPRGLPRGRRRRRRRPARSRDLWIDRGEMIFRYLEVESRRQRARRCCVPMTFARITRRRCHASTRCSATSSPTCRPHAPARPGHAARGREDHRLLRRRHAVRRPVAPEPLV